MGIVFREHLQDTMGCIVGRVYIIVGAIINGESNHELFGIDKEGCTQPMRNCSS